MYVCDGIVVDCGNFMSGCHVPAMFFLCAQSSLVMQLITLWERLRLPESETFAVIDCCDIVATLLCDCCEIPVRCGVAMGLLLLCCC